MKLGEIAARIGETPLRNARRVVALAGAPASGKSTLAAQLATLLPRACVLPMDGFHLENTELHQRGLFARKGAPETFDAAGFCALVSKLHDAGVQPYPTFDRARDAVVADGGEISAQTETVIVEGNYLLFDHPAWQGLAAHWDLTLFLDVPETVLRERLKARWEAHGHSPEAAQARAAQNDLPNAQRIIAARLPCDWVLNYLEVGVG